MFAATPCRRSRTPTRRQVPLPHRGWMPGLALLAIAASGIFGCQRTTVPLIKEFSPVAQTKAVVISGEARFTILTPAMVRMEWSPSGVFEDRPTLVFTNRRLPVPDFTARRKGGWLILRTSELTLRYQENSGRFTTDTLRVEYHVNGAAKTWTPGTPNRGNLKGTVRTLDNVSGSTPLEPGLLSRDGWVVIDDSRTPVFDEAGDPPWAAPRTEAKALDWYFLGYGRDYKRALADYTRVAGRIPMPPRYVFGVWWSRWWPYTDQDYKNLIQEFRTHDVPLDVLVLDMDWHLPGWTGYTWNRELLPDPEGFLRWVHNRGLHVTLNLHPADGVKKHEEAFETMARTLGIDPATTDTVAFDCTCPRYMRAYFDLLHRPLERQGVDFWWIDWQQGKRSGMKGLDPLFWLNHLHWTDMERNPEREGKRPLLMSRWGGLGNHRYPLGFSGDTYCNWESLAFQPYFTATAGNVGYPYWSHDIGGHQPGPVGDELFTRWVQWAVFNPIVRTHATINPKAERRLWGFSEETFEITRAAYHRRYAMLPYIYTAARQGYDDALPLCRPMYYEWPELEEAYDYRGQYFFGDQLLVAPVASPVDPVSRCATQTVWLPPGEWTHWDSGRTYAGPAVITLLTALDEIPVFVREGGIIPMMPKMSSTAERPVDPLMLHLFPGAKGQTRVYEDDGITTGYQQGACAWTPVRFERSGKNYVVEIGPAEGKFPGMLRERVYEIWLRDTWPARGVMLDGHALPRVSEAGQTGWRYDPQTLSVVLRLPRRPVGTALRLEIAFQSEPEAEAILRNGLRGRLVLLERLHRFYKSATPPSVTRALELRSYLKSSPRDAASRAEEVVLKSWSTILKEAGEADVAPDIHKRILGALVGLSGGIEAQGTRDGENRIGVHARFQLLEPIEGVSGAFGIETPPGWRTEGPNTKAFDAIDPNTPLEFRTELSADGSLRTTLLRGRLELRHANWSLTIPIEQTLLPSINGWWIVGPFDNPEGISLDRVFPPEKRIDLRARYVGKDKQRIGWKAVTREIGPKSNLTDEFLVQFDKVFGLKYEHAMAYAFTYVHSPETLDAVLAVGSDDGVAVWLNGEEVHRNPAGRPYTSREDRVPIRLREGVNLLLLKISQGSHGWCFGAHIETPDGDILPQVVTRLTP